MKPKPLGLSAPDLGPRERAAVAAVLRTPWLSRGPEVGAFEREFAAVLGVPHAVAMSSGTCALHVAVRALELQPGDEVVTTPFSFVASANCLLFEGVRPVFADIEPETLNLDPQAAAAAITRRTRALLPVDVFGLPCDAEAFRALARRHNLAVIEDSCEALGARRHGRLAGTLGDIGAFGFYPNKQITTGEGGMLVTRSARVAKVARSLINQGRDHGRWLVHDRLGYNYRMDEMSAALGRVQLSRLDSLLRSRRRVAAAYAEAFTGTTDVTLLREPPESERSWFVYVVYFPTARVRTRVERALTRQGIGHARYFPPIHLQTYMRERFHFRTGQFPVTERAAETGLALPFHGRLTRADVERVVRAVRGAV